MDSGAIGPGNQAEPWFPNPAPTLSAFPANLGDILSDPRTCNEEDNWSKYCPVAGWGLAAGRMGSGGLRIVVLLEVEVPQCGYCQAGQIMSAAALLKQHPNPIDAQIDGAMEGNLCRCGTYLRIREAIPKAVNVRRPTVARPSKSGQ